MSHVAAYSGKQDPINCPANQPKPTASEQERIAMTALMVILNHVEPGWENCVATVRQWLIERNGYDKVI